MPKPAFSEPAPIPACNGVNGPQPGALGAAGVSPQAKLLLTPSKIIAPINSEVVLLAGICGSDGHYICKQPIEWMLSPDSVGNILALADSAHPYIAKLANHSPSKECNTLAITRTTTAAHMITRGTSQANDDTWVGKGQTWISVSSPTEGVSHVTALARGEENWDFRRQTATIHWVDLQWSFPSPQIVRAGQPCPLSTAVTRTSTGRPATGAIVRYDIVDGTPASLFGEGRTSLEVQVNENGRADVQVVETQPGPGTTTVRVQILSSDPSASGSERAVIGQGFTTITWSAPGLTVSVAGPSSVARGAVATYRIDISNPGDVVTRGVQVQFEVPPSLKYLNSLPAGELFGNRLAWRVGDLGPKQTVRIDVSCQAANGGEVRLAARAVSQDAAEAIGRAETRIVESSLALRFVDPPQTASVGQVVGFNFEVTNTGGSVLQQVVIRDTFDEGLQPNYAVDPNRPLELQPFSLAPGETKQQSVTFVPRRAGQLCHTLEATADGGHIASDRACLEVAQPVLGVEVRKTGPQQARVGDRVPFSIVVTNTGEGVLTNLRIADRPDQNLRPDQGSRGYQLDSGSIVWTVDTLGPKQTVTLALECICERESLEASNTVQVTADGGVRQSATATLTIEPALQPAPTPAQPPVQPRAPQPPAQPPSNATPPAANVTGEFKVSLIAGPNGVRMDEVGTFFVFLRNERNVDDSDVIVSLRIPEGLEYVRHTWSSVLPMLSDPNNRRVVEVGPIKSIAARQSNLNAIKFDLRGTKPGEYEIKVQVRSRLTQTPIEASARTFVSAQ